MENNRESLRETAVEIGEEHSSDSPRLAGWQQMFHYFMFKREEYLQQYPKRSNLESTVSMLKRKFGDSLRSKTDRALMNEALCKVLCHNLVVLIHEMHELGMESVFWQSATA